MSIKNLFNIEGKIAVVTGGNGMLGSQFCKILKKSGSKVISLDLFENDRNESDYFIKCDVASEKDWVSSINKIIKKYSVIDILINSAAYTNNSKTLDYDKTIFNYSIDDWEKVVKCNLTGTFIGCREVGKVMVKQNYGSIINISSIYGITSPNHDIYKNNPISQPISYSVTKSGIISLTRYLATLWAKNGVRVNSISPGGVFNYQNDDFINEYCIRSPIGRMADEDEINGSILYLASSASKYVTGHNLVVDGGWTCW
tara:strand:- start:2821 stop:3591 length:771 start_codon:yes stop_codon:yes gene_type:complete